MNCSLTCPACLSHRGVIATWLRQRENRLLFLNIRHYLITHRREPVQA